jgi:hypothetical protein
MDWDGRVGKEEGSFFEKGTLLDSEYSCSFGVDLENEDGVVFLGQMFLAKDSAAINLDVSTFIWGGISPGSASSPLHVYA